MLHSTGRFVLFFDIFSVFFFSFLSDLISDIVSELLSVPLLSIVKDGDPDSDLPISSTLLFPMTFTHILII